MFETVSGFYLYEELEHLLFGNIQNGVTVDLRILGMQNEYQTDRSCEAGDRIEQIQPNIIQVYGATNSKVNQAEPWRASTKNYGKLPEKINNINLIYLPRMTLANISVNKPLFQPGNVIDITDFGLWCL